MFNRVFHYFHHPFWSTPIFWKLPGGGFKDFFKTLYFLGNDPIWLSLDILLAHPPVIPNVRIGVWEALKAPPGEVWGFKDTDPHVRYDWMSIIGYVVSLTKNLKFSHGTQAKKIDAIGQFLFLFILRIRFCPWSCWRLRHFEDQQNRHPCQLRAGSNGWFLEKMIFGKIAFGRFLGSIWESDSLTSFKGLCTLVDQSSSTAKIYPTRTHGYTLIRKIYAPSYPDGPLVRQVTCWSQFTPLKKSPNTWVTKMI